MLIEYRSGLISLLSIDARPAFTGPHLDDCLRHFLSAPRSDLLNTVVMRSRPPRARRPIRRSARPSPQGGVTERAAPAHGGEPSNAVPGSAYVPFPHGDRPSAAEGSASLTSRSGALSSSRCASTRGELVPLSRCTRSPEPADAACPQRNRQFEPMTGRLDREVPLPPRIWQHLACRFP